jgi:hypothetical protein
LQANCLCTVHTLGFDIILSDLLIQLKCYCFIVVAVALFLWNHVDLSVQQLYYNFCLLFLFSLLCKSATKERYKLLKEQKTYKEICRFVGTSKETAEQFLRTFSL